MRSRQNDDIVLCTPTLRILRLMIDSAANTLSPTADSSMFTYPHRYFNRQLDSLLDGYFFSPLASEFQTDHNTLGLQRRHYVL